jgi:hypothetical protein
MNTIEDRIRALEVSNRRQRYAIAALSATIVGAALVAATRPVGDGTFDMLTCKVLKVLDLEGNVRIAALPMPDGDSSIVWMDEQQRVRMRAGTRPGLASIRLFGVDQKPRVAVAASADLAGVVVIDNEQRTRIAANSFANGEAALSLLDVKGKERIKATTLQDGRSGLLFMDPEGVIRVMSGVTADGTVILPAKDLKSKPAP